MDHFALLGVRKDAADAEIQTAYHDLVRKYHPDKVPAELADLKGQLADLFSRITVAHQTLKDVKKRREYVESLAMSAQTGGMSEEDVVKAIIDAETTYQKARILLRTNQIEEAHRLAKEAVQANPEQGDYLALLAWVEAKRKGLKEDVSDLIPRLREAVELAPKSENARFYFAELLRRAGKLREALEQYEWVMQINQHNVDAVRQVRLLRRQFEKGKAGDKKGQASGIMGKLFKKL
jgi:curved DNA-binding protein CbpA